MSSEDHALSAAVPSRRLDDANTWFWPFLKTEFAPYPRACLGSGMHHYCSHRFGDKKETKRCIGLSEQQRDRRLCCCQINLLVRLTAGATTHCVESYSPDVAKIVAFHRSERVLNNFLQEPLHFTARALLDGNGYGRDLRLPCGSACGCYRDRVISKLCVGLLRRSAPATGQPTLVENLLAGDKLSNLRAAHSGNTSIAQSRALLRRILTSSL